MKTVLLIEDDNEIAMSIGIRLKAMGYKVASASDAISAIAQARSLQADVAVIDVNLPGGDGFVVAERLQTLAETRLMPIIFMTASKKVGLKERAERFGAIDFLEKPFDAKRLVNAIDRAVYTDVPFEDNQVELMG